MGPKAIHRIAQREAFGHLQTAFGLLWCWRWPLLGKIVTGDETWTHHYEPESKHQSMDWKLRHSPTKKKFKTHSTAGKLMLTVFGTLSRGWLNNEQCPLQCDELKPAIQGQWRVILSESIVMLHDNASPHTVTHTVETLKKLNFEVMEHPLFGPLKRALRGRRFTTDQQLAVMVHAWLVSQAKTFYSEVIKQIVRWWITCILSKLCSCKISTFVFISMKCTLQIIIDSPSYHHASFYWTI